MVNPIETLHDLANWIKAYTGGLDAIELTAHLLQGPPDKWKKCRDSRCQKIYPATNDYFDNCYNNRDGLSHVCKACRRKSHAAYTRRKRAAKKMSPADLAEINKHRTAGGLDPLPLGPNAPARGRPRKEDNNG